MADHRLKRELFPPSDDLPSSSDRADRFQNVASALAQLVPSLSSHIPAALEILRSSDQAQMNGLDSSLKRMMDHEGLEAGEKQQLLMAMMVMVQLGGLRGSFPTLSMAKTSMTILLHLLRLQSSEVAAAAAAAADDDDGVDHVVVDDDDDDGIDDGEAVGRNDRESQGHGETESPVCREEDEAIQKEQETTATHLDADVRCLGEEETESPSSRQQDEIEACKTPKSNRNGMPRAPVTPLAPRGPPSPAEVASHGPSPPSPIFHRRLLFPRQRHQHRQGPTGPDAANPDGASWSLRYSPACSRRSLMTSRRVVAPSCYLPQGVYQYAGCHASLQMNAAEILLGVSGLEAAQGCLGSPEFNRRKRQRGGGPRSDDVMLEFLQQFVEMMG